MISIRMISAFVAILAAASSGWTQTGGRIRVPEPKATRGPMLLEEENTVDDVRRWLLGLTKKIQPKDLEPKKLKELMDKLPKDQKPDPKQIEELLNSNPEFKHPDFLKQLEKLVGDEEFPKQLNQKLPDDAKLPPNINKRDLKDKLGQVIETGTKQDPFTLPKDMTAPNVDGANPEQPKDASDPGLPKSNASENEWVKWMEKNFGNSPAAEGAVKDLIKALEKQDGKGMFDDIPELKNSGWKDVSNWGKNSAGESWKMKPPDMQGSKMTSPKVGSSGGGSSWGGGNGSGSSWGSGGGGGLEGGGTALALIAGIAAAIFLAFLLFRKWKLIHEEKAVTGSAGQDGIDFDSVRSREELVRVFDAVSLDQCGEDARPWNHRAVADQFGRAKPAIAKPAEQVAELYERARYAPADEDLSTNEFAEARRDLRLLAGAPA